MRNGLQESQAITFEAAIAQTQELLDQVAYHQIADDDLRRAIAMLVSSENGARGFFVTYLTDERSFGDQPSPEVVQALSSSPEIVAELLVKNLAMSSAMAVYHRRNQDQDSALGSDRVQIRTSGLIQALDLPIIREKAQRFLESATTGTGDYQAFLERWGYDSEQRQVIQTVFQQILSKSC
jgi:hypothetical protein